MAVERAFVDAFGAELQAAGVSYWIEVMHEAGAGGELGIGGTICSHAQELGAVAVVMVSHGRRRLTEMLMGSVSNYVAHKCSQPVLLLHQGPQEGAALSPGGNAGSSGCQYLVAVDSSAESLRACRWVAEELYRPGDLLHLLHVTPCRPPRTVYGVGGVAAHYVPAAEQPTAGSDADPGIDAQLVADLGAAGIGYQLHVVRSPIEGTADEIGAVVCQAAEDVGAAAVVVGSHTRGGVAEYLLGSVAMYVTHNCPRPVAVLH